jgi:hypothetical protein
MEMLEQVEAATVTCAATPAWPLPDADILDCLDVAHRLEQEAAAVMLHLVHAADTRGLAQSRGFRSTAGWLRSLLRLDPLIARTMVDLSAAIDRHPEVDRALSCGTVDVRQATAISGPDHHGGRAPIRGAGACNERRHGHPRRRRPGGCLVATAVGLGGGPPIPAP